MIIHVIKPNGTRFEAVYAAGTPDTKILNDLGGSRRVFGRVGRTAPQTDHKTGVAFDADDVNTAWAWDDPACRVVEVKPDTTDEIRVLRGTPAPSPNAPQPTVVPAPIPPTGRPRRSRAGIYAHTAPPKVVQDDAGSPAPPIPPESAVVITEGV